MALLVHQNKEHIPYLLSLYNIDKQELLDSISKGLKKPLQWGDIYCDEINLNNLKRIDKFFNKGLVYYTDPVTPKKEESTSVFFRKKTFNSELNIEDKKRVREFEDLKTSISAMNKLSDIKLNRQFKTYRITDNAKDTALDLRDKFIPNAKEYTKKRDFLKAFINRLGQYNIFVFEFVEAYNKKNKTNLDGFFLQPDTIVLKRQQNSFSREIFTLSHELGHYMLNKEEIEKVDVLDYAHKSLSETEKWCNDFAFYLLIGNQYSQELDKIKYLNGGNGFVVDLINEISNKTFISRIAIYTNLLLQNKLSYNDYIAIKKRLDSEWQEKERVKFLQKQQDKLAGKKTNGRNPQPIKSDLVTSLFNIALSSGVINEYDYCKNLNIKPADIDKYMYI